MPQIETRVKSEILAELKEWDLGFVFTKADGTERTLFATSRVPEEYLPKAKSDYGNLKSETPVVKQARVTPDTHLKVFDLENKVWRTIVIERIKKIFHAD